MTHFHGGFTDAYDHRLFKRQGRYRKTYVAVNLAAAAGNCTYIDCDVEEPNGRLLEAGRRSNHTGLYKTAVF